MDLSADLAEDARLGKNQGMPEPMIELRGVEKSYPQGGGQVFVLRRVDLKVDEGEFVSIMGPSGAGKSTLLHILGMHDGDFTGESPVRRAGAQAQAQAAARAAEARVGFVFQSYHLLDDLTVAENLDLPLSYRDLKKPEREAIVADTLDRFHIVGKKDLYPRQLSGGQQQLVAVARAIMANPKLILADEPTGNLHSEQGREIMELFQKLNGEGTTIIQVTHSETNAGYGRRIVRMRDGWIMND